MIGSKGRTGGSETIEKGEEKEGYPEREFHT